jgi:hypothetical protein
MATIEPYVARGRQPLDLSHRLPAKDALVVEQTIHAGKDLVLVEWFFDEVVGTNAVGVERLGDRAERLIRSL